MALNKNLAPGVKAAGANCKNIADPVARKRCEDAARKGNIKAKGRNRGDAGEIIITPKPPVY